MSAKSERRTRSRQRVPGSGRSKLITYKGRTQQLFEWADELGIARKTLTSRLARRMPVAEAFTMTTLPHATVEQSTERRVAIYKIVEAQQPMTVRAVFYQAEVHLPQFIAKTEAGYKMVQQDLALMRKSGELPYEWITDSTRNVIEGYAYDSIADALEQTAEQYRVNLWRDADCLVQVWLEKDALSGVIEPVTLACGVPLMVARGYQ